MISPGRIYAISSKEFRQLYRDRLSFGMIVGIPLLLILLFGYAIDLDVRRLEAGVVDLSNTQLSRNLVQDMEATQVVEVTHHVSGQRQLKRLMDEGKIKVGIYIPGDFNRRLSDNTRKAAQILIDGTDPTIARVAKGLTRMRFPESTVNRTSNEIFETRTYYNPENRSAIFIVPAISGVILQLTMVLFTAIAIVRERERGNLELLISTPISKTELMLGKILPYIVIGVLQASIIFITGFLLFDVRVEGSLADLYFSALLFIAAVLSLGLLVSTVAKNQFQAMQMTMMTLLPSIFLSGYMFPFDGMPLAAQYIGKLLPLTH
jgi:ABC-2 type transport system permease protein